jgi:DNA-binding XRE family transcriptional regulator
MGIIFPMRGDERIERLRLVQERLAKIKSERRGQVDRLKLVRERLHKIKSQRQMAAVLGVSYQTYNNWERGLPLGAQGARIIKNATPGISGDWLLWGDETWLTVDILRKLKSKL